MADLGSAILQGMQAVQDSAARRQQMRLARDELALSQQRTDLDRQRTESALAVDRANIQRLDDERTKALRADATNNFAADNDRLIGAGMRLGVLDISDEHRPLNGGLIRDALLSPDELTRATAERFVVDFANQDRRKRRLDSNDYTPDDFQFTSLDPEALAQGQVVVRGAYKDGRPGVATVDGSADPSSPILSLSLDDAAKQMELFFKVGVLPFSNMGGSDSSTRATVAGRLFGGNTSSLGRAPASAPAPAQPQTVPQAVNSLLPRIDSAATTQGGVALSRDVRAVLAEVQNNPAEFGKRVVEIAKRLGIDIPPVLQIRPNDGRRNAGDEPDLVEPEKPRTRPDPAVPSAHKDPFAGAVQMLADMTGDGASDYDASGTPLGDIEAKIAYRKRAAAKLTGDAAIKAETEIANLESQRHQLVTEINTRQFKGINSEIDSLTRTRERVSVERRGAFDEKIAALKRRREAYIDSGFITPAMRNEAFQELTTTVFSRLKDAKPEDVARLVDSGMLKFPKKQVTAMTARAREVGVKRVDDIAKLPSNAERMTLLAMMYSWGADSNERNQIMNAMRNVQETGIMSMSRDDLVRQQLAWAQIQISRRRLTLDEAQLELNRAAAMRQETQDAIASGKDVGSVLTKARSSFADYMFSGAALPKEHQGFRAAPGMDHIRSAALLVTTPLLQAAQDAEAQGRDSSQIRKELNVQTSAIIAAIGNVNNTGLLFEKPLNVSGRNLFANQDSSVGLSDSSLGRVRAIYGRGRDGEPKITGFQYMNANEQDTGETVTLAQLNSIDPSLAPLAKAAAEYYERAKADREADSVNIPRSGPQDPRLRE